MLADTLAWISGHYLTLLLLMFAGACFVLAGLIWLFVIRRKDLTLGEHLTVRFETPPPVYPTRAVKSHRADDDTRVIPGIPGALPPRHAPTIATLTGATPDQWVAQQDWINAIDANAEGLDEFARVEGLRIIPSAALWPEEPKSAPEESEETQLVDLCPLTTQDIQIPDDEPTPHYVATPSGLATQELGARMAEILGRERVA